MKFKTLYIWFAIPVAIVLAWIFLFYMPLSAKTKTISKELLSLRQEEERLDLELASIYQMKGKYDNTKESLRKFYSSIPVLDEMPNFIRSIVESAKRNGVVITSFNSMFETMDRQKTQLLMTPTFEIGLKGKFIDMGRFLEELENQNAFKRILSASIGHDQKEYPALAGKFVIEFKAWRIKQAFEDK